MTVIGLPAMPATHFDTPDDHTATEPPERRGLRRDGVRLLVADHGRIAHARFDQLGDHLRPGDVLVINTSATLAGQFDALRDGRRVIVHLANRLADGYRVVEIRSAPDAGRPLLNGRPGEQIELPAGGALTLVEPYPAPHSSPTGTGNRLWRGTVSVPGRLQPYLERHARPISYGYLKDRFPLAAYQTIFAVHPGQRRDAERRPPVQCRTRRPVGGRRADIRADHAAHRGVVAGRGRGAAGRVVPVPGPPRTW